MLLSADFLSITLFPPGSHVTVPVRQVSKLSCQPGFLGNLAGLLPAYLPSDLEIYLKDGVGVRLRLLPSAAPGHPHCILCPEEMDLMVSRFPSQVVPLASSLSLWRKPCCQTQLFNQVSKGSEASCLVWVPHPMSGKPISMLLVWFPPCYFQRAVTPQGL